MIELFMNILHSADVLAAALDKETVIQLTTTLICCFVACVFLWCPLPLFFGLMRRKGHRAIFTDIRTIQGHVTEIEEEPDLTKFQRLILASVKCKHGTPRDTEPNRDVIRRAIVAEIFSDEKRLECFRKVDMVKHVTILIACVFTPTKHEIDCSEAEHDTFYTSYLYKVWRALSYLRCSPLELSPMEKKARYVRAAL
jgi:hypothetical protein